MSCVMLEAKKLRSKDIIEVPIESCQVIKAKKVPGQLKNRKKHLIELTVVPLTGPWSGCEGVFIAESDDLIPVVKKYTRKDERREALRLFLQAIKEKLFGPKIEEVPKIESKKVDALWT